MSDEQKDLPQNQKVEDDANKNSKTDENRNSQMSQETIKSSSLKSNLKTAVNNFNSFIKNDNSVNKTNYIR